MSDLMPFSGSPLDRAANLKHGEGWLEARLAAPESRFLPFWRLQVLAHESDESGLLWLDASVCRHLDDSVRPVFLGLRDSTAHFAVDLSALEEPLERLGLADASFAEARGLATRLPAGEAGIVAQGRSLIDWHRRHGFCGACGAATEPRNGGAMRKCEACNTEHFPRTDPVVIMVVWRGDRCVLARGRGRTTGAYSTLAGYIEQGETIEEAVRREVMEEVGLEVGQVEYHASQPWPFPSTLMIGCFAAATSEELVVDPIELETARWFTRAEIRQALTAPDADRDFLLPTPVAIAHHLIRDWSELSER